MARSQSPRKDNEALLILDLISGFRFEGARKLLRPAHRAAKTIARLKSRAKAAGRPVIYVNDTMGKWESDQTAFIARCLDGPGAEIIKLIEPQADDYFIFKPRHSGFYATPLEELLERLAVRGLCLTGMTTHQCVLFTAVDAYVRKFSLVVPSDAVASHEAEETRHALFILRTALRARTPKANSVVF